MVWYRKWKKKKSILHKRVLLLYIKEAAADGKNVKLKKQKTLPAIILNFINWSSIILAEPLTSLTVWLSLLHVKGLVPDGSLAGCTLEALNMVGHLQGVHDFLAKWEEAWPVTNKKQPAHFQWLKSIQTRCATRELSPLWSSFCTWHSLERIDYRSTWYNRRTLSPRRSPPRPEPSYTVSR